MAKKCSSPALALLVTRTRSIGPLTGSASLTQPERPAPRYLDAMLRSARIGRCTWSSTAAAGRPKVPRLVPLIFQVPPPHPHPCFVTAKDRIRSLHAAAPCPLRAILRIHADMIGRLIGKGGCECNASDNLPSFFMSGFFVSSTMALEECSIST